MESKDMKQQAQYIWNRLDDLASTDPNAYKKFIEEQMKERDLYNSSPEPRICICVKAKLPVIEKLWKHYVLVNKDERWRTLLKYFCSIIPYCSNERYRQLILESHDWFINICAWKRIPYPKDDSEPLKLMCGFKLKTSDSKSHCYGTIPVAANDKVLDEILKSSFDKVEFIKLVIQLVTTEQKISLEEDFQICKDLYKGDVPADPRRLFVKNPQLDYSEASIRNLMSENTSTMNESLSSPESLIKTISSEKNGQSSTSNTDYMEALMKTKDSASKKLVEEVGNAVKTPDYTLNENQLGKIVLKINLPGVKSSAECDLTISQKVIELKVEGLYSLKVELPRLVDEETTQAKFAKKTSALTLTMPVLK